MDSGKKLVMTEEQMANRPKVVTGNGVDITYACVILPSEDGINWAVELPSNLPSDVIIRVDGEVVCSTGTPDEQRELAVMLDAQQQAMEAQALEAAKRAQRFRPKLLSAAVDGALKFGRVR